MIFCTQNFLRVDGFVVYLGPNKAFDETLTIGSAELQLKVFLVGKICLVESNKSSLHIAVQILLY